MNTLLELITFTKGMEYLLAIWFVIGSVALWQWVRGKGHLRLITIGLLMYMVMGIGIGMAGCLAGGR